MSFKIIRPLTDEQKRARKAKQAEREDSERKIEQDLIIAELLEKIAQLEANQNDTN